ncbi:MAG: acetyl-CoA acetyltransferase [Candidatus Fraserbacteria bacterium RBG_16_55_9]|uniref:Acetyl-CoA acetyltransferase n=1 Tax=Fraserbacteria sp. (strain RBG_16_55_9) TaxID=1817864 RepID=A0A1F5V208_FRAXR|nr:MAG: acetyl-CoA acetyltransferase [Candidatus Fraserbacteria bacterium RBG_16_55_9]
MNLGKIHKDVAVVGAGMTLFSRRLQETGKEMSWQAAQMALDQAGLTLDDIDAVIMGSAPDAFDGVHKKGDWLIDGAGGVNKPYMRVYTGGGTAVFAPIAGWWHVASGMFERVLVVCEEKMSSCQPHAQSAFAHIWDPILDRPLKPNLVWIFAMEMQRYMHTYNVRYEDIALVAVKNKRNAVGHPCAQLADPDITLEDVINSEPMALPVRRLDISPPSDGAAALVLVSEDTAYELTNEPVWMDGVGWCIDSTMWTNRDLAFPKFVARAARMAYEMAGIKNPREEIDIAEPYDPFDYKELQHLEALGLADPGEAAIMTREGKTQRDGELPVCPSGGLLGVGNPIAATLGIKVGELFWQLSGQAGARQVPGDPAVGVAQAWGDLMQFSSVIVMRRRP